MIESALFVIFMAVVIVLLVMFSQRIKVAYPVILVLAGLLLSFIPSIPKIKIDPELIFIIFLPPLLYEAAWANSWKEIWKWRRIIFSFAFIVVFITACSVAFVSNYFIPGFSIALGFLLGGIVSPPDAVSAASILKFVKVPRRVATMLEGESLFNDASSLIIVRFAMIVIGTGQFIWKDATLSFLWMVVGGTAIGLALAYIFVLAHKKLPTSASIDVVLMLIAPFLMYISAEVVHASGVMSVVCGGLYLSYRSIHIFNSETRLMGHSVWNSLTFLLNGFVFLLIGLDLSEIISELQKDKIDLIQATIYGIGITLLLMVVRIAVAYVAVYISKLMSRFITVADTRHPGKGAPLVLGWAGMRGVVSLAAALSIPLTLENGEAFPMRSLILYITFVVIFLTLVIQGLTLPMIIKKVKFIDFGDHWNEEETNSFIQKELAKDSLNFVKGYCNEKLANSERFSRLINFWHHTLETEDKHHSFFTEEERKMYLEVLEHQQLFLWELNTKHANIDEEQINKYIHRIDLEKERIRLESEH